MADYYVSPDGDDANEGTRPEAPLRSLTRATALIAEAYTARGNAAVPELVHLEPGLYSRDSGELFPIIVPVLTAVQGSGADCVIQYSPGGEEFACGHSDTCIELHGTLSAVTVTVAFPPDVWFPVIRVRAVDESAVLEGVDADLVYVDAATRVSQVNFTGMLMTQDGFERRGEVYPLVEDCHWIQTGGYNYGCGFQIWGGRVERCTSGVFWVNSPGRTVIQNNTVDVLYGFVVHRPVTDPAPTSEAMTPQICNNTFQSLATLGDADAMHYANVIQVFGESQWRDNTIYARRLEVGCNAGFVDNHIGVFRADITLTGHWIYDPIGPLGEVRLNCPSFSNNVFEQVYYKVSVPYSSILPYLTGDEPEMGSLLTVTAEACPVFDRNRFLMHEAAPLTPVLAQKYAVPEGATPEWAAQVAEVMAGLPNPDFGGGAGGSAGGNLFHVSMPSVPHVKIDMGAETFELHARNNIWSYEPSIEAIGDGAGVSYDVDGFTLE